MAQQPHRRRADDDDDDDDNHDPPPRQLLSRDARAGGRGAVGRPAGADRRVRMVLSGVRGMAEVFKAAKPTSKHVATVHVAEEGLVMQWEDDAKTMQSSVTFFAQLFSEYDRPEGDRDVRFRLPLAQLAEVLGAFAAASSAADDDAAAAGGGGGGGAVGAAADTAPLVMTYPGPEGELVLELRDDGAASRDSGGAAAASGAPRRRRCTVLTYARIATLGGGTVGGGGGGADDDDEGDDQAGGGLLMDGDWEEPTSYFIAAHQAHMLKEAADDLEWPAAAAGASTAAAGASAAGCGRLTMARDPPALTLSAAVGGGGGGGERSVEVSVPVDDLAAFSCSGPEVSHAFPLRALRAALGHVPTAPPAGAWGGGGGGAAPGQHHHHQQQQAAAPPGAAVEYTKVRVDARGLLSVAHMLRVSAGPGGGGGQAAPGGPTQAMAMGGGGGGAGRGGALVQYVVQPLADEEYGGDGDGDGGF